jgi:hypothetical protein
MTSICVPWDEVLWEFTCGGVFWLFDTNHHIPAAESMAKTEMTTIRIVAEPALVVRVIVVATLVIFIPSSP